ncbi:MAG: Fic/DOC family N-terminal domain-containing protein, partial [Planctomycetota bacterium]
MNFKDFGPESPGEIVSTTASWGPKIAFVPAPLPPSWDFLQDLWPLLNRASNYLHKLDGVGKTLPNPALLLRPLRNREAILSSRMEGTYATARELLLFER